MQLKARPAPQPSIKSQAHPSIPSIPSFQPVRPTGALALINPTPQTNPYFTFWLQILRSLGVQSNPTNPNPIAWIHRSRSFHLRHLAWRARRRAGSPPKVRLSLEKAGCGAHPAPWRAHMASSAPLERSPCSSKRRRTLLLSASARRYGWFRRSAGSRESGAPGRTHGTRRTDRERPAGSQSKQLVEDGSRDWPRRSAGSRTDVPGTTRPSGRLILVGSGCWWDHGNCAVGMAPRALSKATWTPRAGLRCALGGPTLPQTPQLEDVPPHGRGVTHGFSHTRMDLGSLHLI